MVIIEKNRDLVRTITNALELVIEYHSIYSKELSTNRWLRDIKEPSAFTRRMFYFIQHDLIERKIDITNENKEAYIKEFVSYWRKNHNVKLK